MHCGNCFRDNALVAELRKMGHDTLMIPLYLPMTLDEPDQSAGTPIFFSGINVYLEQILPGFSKAPDWVRNVLASPKLLKWAGGRAAKTRADQLGDLTLSMIRGEEGNQARELDELIAWMKSNHAPDAIILSNALLVGLVRKMRRELNAPIAITLQGEDTFLDSLPDSHREKTWAAISERAQEADLFIAPSKYFGELMGRRLRIPPHKIKVIYNGVHPEGYTPRAQATPPVLGYFARMSKIKGLDTLVAAYIHIRAKNLVPTLKLKIGGGCGPSDEPFVEQLKDDLRAAGVLSDVEFHPNLDKTAKQAFINSLSIFSVPTLYGEAFGLYLAEAWAAGVPVVQPRHAAFPELIEASGAGVLCDPGDPAALAEAIASVLNAPGRRAELSRAALEAVRSRFNVSAMAGATIDALAKLPRPQANP